MYVYISIIYIFTYVCFTFIKNFNYILRYDSCNKSSVKKKWYIKIKKTKLKKINEVIHGI